MKKQVIKLNRLAFMRFPSEAQKEIASKEQEGKIEKNRLGCFQW